MKQMKAIVKRYLSEKVRLKRAAAVADQDASVAHLSTVHAGLIATHQVTLNHQAAVDSIVVRQQAALAAIDRAHQAAIVVQQQNAIAAHRAALNHANSIVARHQIALQARHDQALQDHAHDDEWMIAFEYENEEWD